MPNNLLCLSNAVKCIHKEGRKNQNVVGDAMRSCHPPDDTHPACRALWCSWPRGAHCRLSEPPKAHPSPCTPSRLHGGIGALTSRGRHTALTVSGFPLATDGIRLQQSASTPPAEQQFSITAARGEVLPLDRETRECELVGEEQRPA